MDTSQHTRTRFSGWIAVAVAAGLSVMFASATSAGQLPASPAPDAAAARQRPAGGPLLELSMEKAVEMGLDANLGLQADRLSLESAAHAVTAARSAFMPIIGSSVSRSSSVSVPNDFTQGSSDITRQGLDVRNSLSQVLPVFGTRYDVSLSNSRNSQIGGNPLFNPFLSSGLSFNVTQPLWRGFMTDQNRVTLQTSRRRRDVVDIQLQQQVVRLETEIRSGYLDLLSALEGLNVARQNMDIRQKSLADARARVAVGAAAPVELISAEADVASNQEQVLLAEALIATREDGLRTLILDPTRSDFWQVRIVPTDTLRPQQPAIDLDAAIKQALDHRLDLAVTRHELEISDLALKAARNATHPAVDLRVNYGTSGTGGTRLTYGDGFPPPVVGRSDKGFGSVLSDTFGSVYPQWTAGVNVSYPVGHSAAEAALAQQAVSQRQSQIHLRELEVSIVQQVRDAARQVENSYQRVLATQAALRASEQQLDAEQRRFTTGLSTTLELQVRQGQLASARTAELNAVIAHNRALINFERIQKTQ
ncbi:MAG: TolC family protein [Vicinamibacterales bacterium]